MDNIRRYFKEETKLGEISIGEITTKLGRHSDISDEFSKWIVQRNYDFDNPVTIEGYTAKSIAALVPILDGLGVFMLMVTLRDRPSVAKHFIETGFKVK